jgi:glyoxylase-like metal-dependent hydrolase (beta-lactamase superfamily II)
MKCRQWGTTLASALALAIQAAYPARVSMQTEPPAVKSLRLYVLDCGTLTPNREGVERYHVTMREVGEIRMPVPCFLIVHPRGTLMWDVGVIPDSVVEAQANTATANVNSTVAAVVTRTLSSQLAEVGYTPTDITYVAISHAHIDHTANLNSFAGSTWLTRGAERDFMWAENNPRVNPTFYAALKNGKVVVVDQDLSRRSGAEADEHDVFGDGSVIMKAAPGHTPAHQVLILKLARTGPVMLSGDLYHYPEERSLKRQPPDNEFNVAQSAASRRVIEEYLTKTNMPLWIEHDYDFITKLKHAPAFYD